MNFISIKLEDGTEAVINMDNINYIKPSKVKENTTVIYFTNGEILGTNISFNTFCRTPKSNLENENLKTVLLEGFDKILDTIGVNSVDYEFAMSKYSELLKALE